MAATTARIDHDLMDEPHVAGRRISVLQVYEQVEGAGLEPKQVADRFDLDVADVHYALAYYYDNPREMETVRRERKRAFEAFADDVDRPDDVNPET
jgi:uncharacterized protein (DUF433 family)